jgi:REP element-mobilizing transposase RayT
LADSLPTATIEQAERSLAFLPHPQRDYELRRRLQDWVDAGHGSCVLRHPAMAAMMQRTLLHFHGVRYELHAWVVMPNYVHALVQPIGGWSLAKIVGSWKKHAASEVRRFQRRADPEIGVPRGHSPLWHREYWDRYIRNEEHYRAALEYIHQNPVKAGLAAQAEDWPWSSATSPPAGGLAPAIDDQI